MCPSCLRKAPTPVCVLTRFSPPVLSFAFLCFLLTGLSGIARIQSLIASVRAVNGCISSNSCHFYMHVVASTERAFTRQARRGLRPPFPQQHAFNGCDGSPMPPSRRPSGTRAREVRFVTLALSSSSTPFFSSGFLSTPLRPRLLLHRRERQRLHRLLRHPL